MSPSAYGKLLRVAQRCTRRADEAADLLQEALLEAVKAGRTDFADRATQHWLAGVIGNKARLLARGAARRLRRETGWFIEQTPQVQSDDPPDVSAMLTELPPALKAVAALALSGHNRREIGYLLELPDTALRQRIRALKRQLMTRGFAIPEDMPGLNLDLAYGRIREALLPALLRQNGLFASHDPDGHVFIVRRAR
jgi:DNA-directed RNA polymerase specialized sigma24 family protein